jgi:hypothetical protein
MSALISLADCRALLPAVQSSLGASNFGFGSIWPTRVLLVMAVSAVDSHIGSVRLFVTAWKPVGSPYVTTL